MTCLASLAASAETFDALGLEFDAAFTRHLMKGCADMADAYGSEVAEALYRKWTTDQAVRAVTKAQECLA